MRKQLEINFDGGFVDSYDSLSPDLQQQLDYVFENCYSEGRIPDYIDSHHFDNGIFLIDAFPEDHTTLLTSGFQYFGPGLFFIEILTVPDREAIEAIINYTRERKVELL